ncbi:MAG: AraC family transcriptional regulator [Clostridia bacterium]|nr:AraC family transcriptional regulator [Clostridia bacterium]
MAIQYERYVETRPSSGERRGALSDFVPLSYGQQACRGGHSSSGMRDYFMIHYVESGRGYLSYRDKEYTLGAGEIFIVSPGEWHHYRADEQDPWHYSWICFRGSRAADFQPLAPVHAYPHDTFRRLLRAAEYGEYAAEHMAGCLFEILSSLLREEKSGGGEGYAARAKHMVDTLYMLPITVGGIAKQLALDRRYLPRLFRERYGVTLQSYLIRVRMENAVRYLGEGYNAEEAGRLSGYEDPVNFYRMFKRYYGVGPASYRRRKREERADK